MFVDVRSVAVLLLAAVVLLLLVEFRAEEDRVIWPGEGAGAFLALQAIIVGALMEENNG